MQEFIGPGASDSKAKDYLWSTLKSCSVAPGYGHAVLRKPDPRFEVLMYYDSSRPSIAEDQVLRLVNQNSETAPEVLKSTATQKIRIGFGFELRCALPSLWLHETLYIRRRFVLVEDWTVVTHYDRALELPTERPKSINLPRLLELAEKQ